MRTRKLPWMIMGAIVVAMGCSHSARDRFKHWFFEIPPDQTVTDASAERASAPTVEPTYEPPALQLADSKYKSVHQAVVDRDCRKCHDQGQRMQVNEELMMTSCETCHERYFGDEVAHGPAVDGECTECHTLHRSEYLHLLREPVLDTCIGCHDEPEDLSEEYHGADGVEHCTKCHDPHFGGDYFLKADFEERESDS